MERFARLLEVGMGLLLHQAALDTDAIYGAESDAGDLELPAASLRLARHYGQVWAEVLLALFPGLWVRRWVVHLTSPSRRAALESLADSLVVALGSLLDQPASLPAIHLPPRDPPPA